MSLQPGRHALTFVFITVVVDMIGIGLILPVLPALIRELAHVDVAQAAVIGGWLLVAYSAMQFLCGPIVGNLSDAYGRRPVLLLALGGLGIDYVLCAFAPSIAWLFLGRLLAGTFGASHVTAYAYITDVTPADQRAKAFGMIGAAFGIGFVIGPAIGGLLGAYGPRVPFMAAAVLALANVAYGWFVLPESLPPEKRRPFRFKRANPVGSLAVLRKDPLLRDFGVVLFLHFLATAAYPAIWAYYTIYRYGWSELQVGLSLAVYGIVTAAVQGGLVGPIIARLGEWRTALLALCVEVAAGFGYGIASAGWFIYVLIVVGAPQNIALPAINAMMTRRVGASAQGELQGALASITGITAIIGPLIATQLFGHFTGPQAPMELPGAPFFAAMLLSAVAAWLFLRTRSLAGTEPSR